MIEADVSRARRRAVVDQIAASLILQGWLDARQPTAPEDEP
jgi:putative Holliday junction resolvase